MTLDLGTVHVNWNGGETGVLFIALSRFRHPDDVMLDDNFPSMSVAMRQREQWGPDFKLTASGPLSKLEEAIEMAKALRINPAPRPLTNSLPPPTTSSYYVDLPLLRNIWTPLKAA